jgi:hypothetical protein
MHLSQMNLILTLTLHFTNITLLPMPNEGSEFESRWGQELSRLHVVQTGSGAHPTSYPIGTGFSFPGGKAAGAWSWPLTSIHCRGQENMNLYIHSPYAFMA